MRRNFSPSESNRIKNKGKMDICMYMMLNEASKLIKLWSRILQFFRLSANSKEWGPFRNI